MILRTDQTSAAAGSGRLQPGSGLLRLTLAVWAVAALALLGASAAEATPSPLPLGEHGGRGGTFSCDVGSGPGPCASSYEPGTEITVTYAPAAGYSFVRFSSNRISSGCSDQTCEFIMPDTGPTVYAYVASTTRPEIGSFTCDAGNPCGAATSWAPSRIATDEATGDVYVLDSTNDAVQRFSAEGTWLSELKVPQSEGGSLQVPAPPNDADIAVDNSGGPNQGTVYVTSGIHEGPVFAFAPDGSFKWQAIGYEEPCGIAVNSEGEVFTGNYIEGIRQVDLATGAPEGLPFLSGTSSCHIAFDSEDNLYLEHWDARIDRYDAPAYATSTTVDPEGAAAAADSSNKDIYVYLPSFIRAYHFGEYSTPIPGTPFNEPGEAFGPGGTLVGLAVNGALGRIYTSEVPDHEVQIFSRVGGAAPKAGARTEAPSAIGTASATLAGRSNPNGVAVTGCTFEYGTTTALGSSQACTTLPGSGTSEVAVHAPVSSLSLETDYYYRLVTENASGETRGALVKFRTSKPFYALTVNVSGTGSVQCDAGGGFAACAAEYEEGTEVALQATAASGNHFSGWSGACTGTGACGLTIAGPTSVTASFAADESGGGSGGGGGSGSGGGSSSGGGGGSTLPPPQGPTFGQCVAKANKAFNQAKKAAGRKHGKAKTATLKKAKKRHSKAVAACKAQFK